MDVKYNPVFGDQSPVGGGAVNHIPDTGKMVTRQHCNKGW